MTNATAKEIQQHLLEELDLDHPLSHDIQHGFIHLPPAHIDIIDGAFRVWREDDETFTAHFFIKQDMLKDIHPILMSIIRQVDDIQ